MLTVVFLGLVERSWIYFLTIQDCNSDRMTDHCML